MIYRMSVTGGQYFPCFSLIGRSVGGIECFWQQGRALLQENHVPDLGGPSGLPVWKMPYNSVLFLIGFSSILNNRVFIFQRPLYQRIDMRQ